MYTYHHEAKTVLKLPVSEAMSIVSEIKAQCLGSGPPSQRCANPRVRVSVTVRVRVKADLCDGGLEPMSQQTLIISKK